MSLVKMRARTRLLSLVVIAGCTAPLTVAEPRDPGTPGFGMAPPLDSGVEAGEAESLGDPPVDASDDGG